MIAGVANFNMPGEQARQVAQIEILDSQKNVTSSSLLTARLHMATT